MAIDFDTVGKVVGSVLGAGISAGGNIAGAGLSFGNQKKLAQHNAQLNYEYAEKSARNNPTWNRVGLESAGYNPMLAVQNATSGANAGWTSSQSANAPDVAGGISSGVANAQSFQRLKNETQQAESVTDANYSTADKNKAEKFEIIARLPFVSRRQKAEIAQLEAGAQLAEAQKHNLKERLDLDRTLGMMGINVQQSSNAIQAERNRIIESTSPSGRSQSFSNYMQGIRSGLSGIGDIIHGSTTNNYEHYDESRTVTNKSRGSSETVTSRRSGKRRKR